MFEELYLVIMYITPVFLVILAVIMLLRRNKEKKLGISPRQKNQEIEYLGFIFIILGIVFGSDRFIGYSFIGIALFLSVYSAIISKRSSKKTGGK